jgi:hypothetical protein
LACHIPLFHCQRKALIDHLSNGLWIAERRLRNSRAAYSAIRNPQSAFRNHQLSPKRLGQQAGRQLLDTDAGGGGVRFQPIGGGEEGLDAVDDLVLA